MPLILLFVCNIINVPTSLLLMIVRCVTFSSFAVGRNLRFPRCWHRSPPYNHPNYHISQFCLVCDNSYCNHIHIHTYTFTSLFKHCFLSLCCTDTHTTHSCVWTGLLCAIETVLVINSMNYLRNFQLCKHWSEETRRRKERERERVAVSMHVRSIRHKLRLFAV